MTEYVHPRLRLSQVERYAGFIQQALDNWPRETYFEIPAGISPVTFAARLRDAVASYRRYRWPGLNIDDAKFNAIDGAFVVRDPDPTGKVYWAHKLPQGRTVAGAVGCEAVVRPTAKMPKSQRIAGSYVHTESQSAQLGSSSLVIADTSPYTTDDWLTIAKLVAFGVLRIPIEVIGELPQDLQALLMDTYPEVGVAFNSATQRTVIL
jgi:hypothetical protein